MLLGVNIFKSNSVEVTKLTMSMKVVVHLNKKFDLHNLHIFIPPILPNVTTSFCQAISVETYSSKLMKSRFNWYKWHAYSHQCSRLKSSMPINHDLALQNMPLSKQPFIMQPQIENEDVTWSPQYDMPATRTNKHRALSLQEMDLDDRFLILHIVLETCTI